MRKIWLFNSAYMWRFGFAFILLSAAGERALSQQENVEIDPGLPRYVPQAVSLPKDVQYLTPEGEIKIVGYNDMSGMLTKLNDLFAASHPGFRLKLDLKGTRTAPPALTAGISAFAPMGAEFPEADLAIYRSAIGADPVAIRVAHASLNPRAKSGPLVIYVHRDNPLEVLSMEDAGRIFAPSSAGDAITDWKQLGLDRGQIKPCGLNPETPLAKFIQKYKFGGRPFAAHFTGFPQSADVVRQVGEDPQAICFAAINPATPMVKILTIAVAGEPPSPVSTEAIVAGRYPLDRYLYIYVRRFPGKRLDPFVREYLRLVLSREGQEAIATEDLGYLPLSASDAAQELEKLQ